MPAEIPAPRFEDLSALLRDTFWRLDPVGVSFDVEFTWNEYDEIADDAARRAADGEDIEAIEREIVREFREDWGVAHPEETARAAGAAIELYRRRPYRCSWPKGTVMTPTLSVAVICGNSDRGSSEHALIEWSVSRPAASHP